jgi:hypothetical protein
MTLVSTVTLSSSASSIDFTGIPGTATDLMLTVSLRMSTGNAKLWFRFNSSTSGYTYRALSGDGTSAFSGANGDGNDRIASGTFSIPGGTSTFGNATIYIPNYASANNKSVSFDSVGEANATTAYMDINAGLWSNTSAITSISIFQPGNFQTNSTVSLYTITKGSGGATVA